MKKGSNLYSYLESTGLLANGTKEDIFKAKSEYWKLVRKAWQNQKRKECKSYTVFFTLSEHRCLTRALKCPKSSVTGFIKQSALQIAKGSPGVDKITIGQVRKAFFEAYNSIEAMSKEEPIEALKQLITLEQKVLSLLQ